MGKSFEFSDALVGPRERALLGLFDSMRFEIEKIVLSDSTCEFLVGITCKPKRRRASYLKKKSGAFYTDFKVLNENMPVRQDCALKLEKRLFDKFVDHPQYRTTKKKPNSYRRSTGGKKDDGTRCYFLYVAVGKKSRKPAVRIDFSAGRRFR
ncbi:MAG: hypothetical protein EPN36_06825 [Rhodanobacteraceae bacterium]|nr:MAG: hypothetical protein EPN36_06825 [Rhodanobacteraceae bacterium]